MSNKKNRKRCNLYLLMLLAILCMCAYIIVHRAMSKKDNADEETPESTEMLLEADTDSAVELSYQAGKQSVSLVKEGKTWKLVSDKKCPIDQTKVSGMLSIFKDTEVTRKIADTTENKSEYGLDSPSLTVTLTLKDKTKLSYEVGMSAIGESEGYYVSVSGNKGIYLAPETVSTAFQYFGTQLVAIEETPQIEADNIYELNLKAENKTVFSIKENKKEFLITSPAKKNVAADSSELSSLFENYTSYTFDENVAYDCKDLKKYGLRNPEYTVELKYYESSEDDSTEKKGVKKSFTLYIGTTDKSGNYYVKMKESNSVYTMNAASVDSLTNISQTSILN